MNTATLIRLPHPLCTPGILLIDGNLSLFTLELPWLNNKHEVSSIPPSTYNIQFDPQNGRYRVNDVPDRTAIEIHPGNSTNDTHGCLLVGKSLSILTENPYLNHSALAYTTLRHRMGDKFQLVIKNLDTI